MCSADNFRSYIIANDDKIFFYPDYVVILGFIDITFIESGNFYHRG